MQRDTMIPAVSPDYGPIQEMARASKKCWLTTSTTTTTTHLTRIIRYSAVILGWFNPWSPGGTYMVHKQPLRGIVVRALAWHPLGREIESCPGIWECFPLNTRRSGYCHYAVVVMGGWGNLADVRLNTHMWCQDWNLCTFTFTLYFSLHPYRKG